MKMLSHFKIFCCLAILIGCLTACSSEADEPNTGGKVSVSVSLSSKTSGTRASWTLDPVYGEDGEMMKSWFVAIVQNGKVQDIVSNADFDGKEKEMDSFTVKLDAGETTFYSFANLTLADVGLDGITSFPAALPSGFETQTISVAGNKSSASEFADGIPMSNKQTFTVAATTTHIDLEVIRLVAKMHISLTNITDDDITVKRIGITDITNDGNNFYLFPKKATSAGAETIVPNIKNADKGTRYFSNLDGNGGNVTISAGDTKEVQFYVNESEATTTKGFTLMVETDGAAAQRFSMLNWTQIARNDYRELPVKINAYKIEFDVTAFTPIGVLPLVENTDGTLKVTLRTYGDFHIQPKVIEVASASTMAYGTGWTFASGDDALTLLEADPTQESGNGIFSTAPWVNRSTGIIEATAAKRNGYALYQMKINVGGNTLTYKIEIHTDYKY